MHRFLLAVMAVTLVQPCGWARAFAQSKEDLNLQVHGYASQRFAYSTHNNWNTMDSAKGSAAWTEVVANLTANPRPKLSIGIQGRYYHLGAYGERIVLDWAHADYKINERFGFRVGKVKTPSGLLNEVQDIDPAYLWILLPQSIYPLASRSASLSHYGAVLYGAIPLGKYFGKLKYRAYGGERIVASDDGALTQYEANGLQVPNGLSGRTYGSTLRWNTPVQGLMLGVNGGSEDPSGNLTYNGYQGALTTARFSQPRFFGRFERGRIMVAAEYGRTASHGTITFPGFSSLTVSQDVRSFYTMTSYRIAAKLNAGVYYSSSLDRQAAFTPARYQKDWALAGRYDFNSYLYLKAEQHVIDGTEIGYNPSNNAHGLNPKSRMTLLNANVSF